MLKRFMLCGMLALCHISSASEENTAYFTKSKPEIDGIINDECWKDGNWNGNFKVLNNPQKQPGAQTKFKICHDNQNLYIAAIFDEPNPEKIVKKESERDRRSWADDCIELLLDTNRDRTSFYHIAINANGAVYDELKTRKGELDTKEWNCIGIRSAAKINRDNWTIEISIPLSSTGMESGSEVWGINVGRLRKSTNEFTSMLSTYNGFQSPENFRELKFENADFAKFAWQLKKPYDINTSTQKGNINLSFKTYLKNNTDKFRFAQIEISANGKVVKTTGSGLDKGLGKELDLDIPVEKNGLLNLQFKILDRASNETVSLKQFKININCSPVSIILNEPFYRNCIFASQKIHALKGNIKLAIENTKDLHILLSLKDADGKTIKSKTLPVAKDNDTGFSVELPQDFKDGKYFLNAEIKKEKKTLYSSEDIIIRKLPAFNGEVRIDKDLVTRMNGKKFLPYGWFSIDERELASAKSKGYNVTIKYWIHCAPDEKLKKWLDTCLENKIKVLLFPFSKSSLHVRKNWRKPLSKDEKNNIRTFVGKWKKHPAILAWYLSDEPEGKDALPQKLKEIYEICADEDPYHPCIILNNSLAGIYKYSKAADILQPDPYPLFIKGRFSSRPIERVTKFINAIHEAGKNRKAAWITPQAFSYGDFGKPNNRPPVFRELRNMQYQAVCAGATGIIWWTYGKSRCYPDLYQGVPFLCKETDLLKNLILSPQKRTRLKTGDKLVEAVYYKDIDGADWIVSVNNATEKKKIKLSLPKNSPETWYVFSGNESINSRRNVLNIEFEYYETKIFTTDKGIASALSLKSIREKIKELRDNPPGKEGNLFGKECKTSASNDGQLWHRGGSRHLVDACRNCIGWRISPSKDKGEWAEIVLPEKKKIGRIELFSRNRALPEHGEIMAKVNGSWVKIAPLGKAVDAPESEDSFSQSMSISFEPLETNAIRIHLTKYNKAEKFQISEIEAYEK